MDTNTTVAAVNASDSLNVTVANVVWASGGCVGCTQDELLTFATKAATKAAKNAQRAADAANSLAKALDPAIAEVEHLNDVAAPVFRSAEDSAVRTMTAQRLIDRLFVPEPSIEGK